MKDKLLLIRADASKEIGHGHVMRCLALAQEWTAQGGRVAVATTALEYSLVSRLKQARIEIFELRHDDANITLALAYYLGADWIVVDGYQFDSYYMNAMADSDAGVLVIDEFGQVEKLWVDMVLNHNSYASRTMYNEYDSCRFLLGTEYVLLRDEFNIYRDWVHPISPVVEKVLVTLGGTANASSVDRIIDIVYRVLPLSHCVTPDSTDYISSAMAWADIAISAAGSTSLELAFMGVPTILVAVADNQRKAAFNLSDKGISLSLGDLDKLSDDKLVSAITGICDQDIRKDMSERGQKLVDGRGAERVVKEMLNE